MKTLLVALTLLAGCGSAQAPDRMAAWCDRAHIDMLTRALDDRAGELEATMSRGDWKKSTLLIETMADERAELKLRRFACGAQ